MPDFVKQHGETIPQSEIDDITMKRHHITEAINKDFYGSSDQEAHSFYVGSYGRHTATEFSDVDLLVELPKEEYERFDTASGNGQSRLLQAVRSAIKEHYSKSNVHADGQVVVIDFSNGRKFEILPAFKKVKQDPYQEDAYTYPDTNDGGRWRPTYPKLEIDAMLKKNRASNGLLEDTCRHIRKIRDGKAKELDISAFDLHGIVIDSFVYSAIGNWRWCTNGEPSRPNGEYEKTLLDKLDEKISMGSYSMKAPGSNQYIWVDKRAIRCLREILKAMAC